MGSQSTGIHHHLPILAGALNVCFTISVSECTAAQGSCCPILAASFHKLAILTSSVCEGTVSNVLVGGLPESFDVSHNTR
jgi:hypothetical protein